MVSQITSYRTRISNIRICIILFSEEEMDKKNITKEFKKWRERGQQDFNNEERQLPELRNDLRVSNPCAAQ